MVTETTLNSIGVDRPEDLVNVETAIKCKKQMEIFFQCLRIGRKYFEKKK